MLAELSILGSDFLFRCGDRTVRIPIREETLARFEGWSDGYARAVETNDPPALFAIGSEMFAWLDESGSATTWVQSVGDRVLEVGVRDPGSEAAAALLDLPWEALARR